MNGKIFVVILSMLMLGSTVLAIGPDDYPFGSPPVCCGSPFGASYYDGFCDDDAIVCGLICIDGSPCYRWGGCFEEGDACVHVEGLTVLNWGYDCNGGYGYGYGGYGCDTDTGGGGGDKILDVEVEYSCDEEATVITATSTGGSPVYDVHVTMQTTGGTPLGSGDTNIEGKVMFGECAPEVLIHATKNGYDNIYTYEYPNPVSLDCECGEGNGEEPLPEPEVPPTEPEVPPTEPPPECTTDADCATTQVCSGGSCMDITGQCGYAQDHTWVQYECGKEEGCDECPQGLVCVEHECKPGSIEGEDGVVGDTQDVTTEVGDEPCRNCDVEIKTPDGKTLTGQTDEDGILELPLTMEGEYMVSLLDENGDVVATTTIQALAAGPIDDEGKEAAAPDDPTGLFLLILIILAAGAIAIIYLNRGKSGKKR